MENDSQEYEIRRASAEDLDKILELLEPLFDSQVLLRRNPEEMQSLLKTGFVATVRFGKDGEAEVVGFCAVEVYSKKLAEIQCLGVSPTHRTQGLGRKLVQRCVDVAKEKGVMEVMAISSSEKFLQDLGFDYSLPQQKRALFFQIRKRGEN